MEKMAITSLFLYTWVSANQFFTNLNSGQDDLCTP